MELLTQELRKQLPPLGATENDDDPIAIVKFFTPDGSWTWFAFEFDGEDRFNGAVSGIEFELGCFCLSELQEMRGAVGMPIERDIKFKPTPLSKITEQYDRNALRIPSG